MALRLSEVWEQLNSYDPVKSSQGMAEIRARIQQEDMSIYWDITIPNNKLNLDIYWFSYEKEDYDAECSLNNSSKPNTITTENNTTETFYFNNYPEQNTVTAEDNQTEEPYFKNISNPNLLSFKDWLRQNEALIYVSAEEQKIAYQRYIKSI